MTNKINLKVYIIKKMDNNNEIREIEYTLNVEYPNNEIHKTYVLNMFNSLEDEIIIKSDKLDKYLMKFSDKLGFIECLPSLNVETIEREFTVNENIQPDTIKVLLNNFFQRYSQYIDFEILSMIGDYIDYNDIDDYLDDLTDEDFNEEICLNENIDDMLDKLNDGCNCFYIRE